MIRSWLQELGVGLSAVFGIFVMALVVELCYIFCWKKGPSAGAAAGGAAGAGGKIIMISEMSRKNGDHSTGEDDKRIFIGMCNDNSTRKKKSGGSTCEYAREAAFLGGYDAAATVSCNAAGIGGGGKAEEEEEEGGNGHLLFSIKEETKEDLEQAATPGCAPTANQRRHTRSRTPSDVVTVHFTSGSSSSPETCTPPSSSSASPQQQQQQQHQWLMPSSPPPETPAGPTPSGVLPCSPRAHTPLRLLFERSPLLGPRPLRSANHGRPHERRFMLSLPSLFGSRSK